MSALPAPAHRTHHCLSQTRGAHLCAVLPDARSTCACHAPPCSAVRSSGAAVRCMTGTRPHSRQLGLSRFHTHASTQDAAITLIAQSKTPAVHGRCNRRDRPRLPADRRRRTAFVAVTAVARRALARSCQAVRSSCLPELPPSCGSVAAEPQLQSSRAEPQTAGRRVGHRSRWRACVALVGICQFM